MSSIGEHEKRNWYKTWKFWAFAGYALVIVIICLCLFVSIQEIPTWSLVPESAFAFISININEDVENTTSLIENVEALLLHQESGFLKKFIIKRAFSSLPERIIVIAATGKEAKPEILMILKLGGIARVAKMFSGQLDRVVFDRQVIKEEKTRGHRIKYVEDAINSMGIGAYSIIGNTLVAASSIEIMQESLTSYPQSEAYLSVQQHLTPMFLRGTERQAFMIFADNGARDLSKVVFHIEQKYAFALFPSMDAVEMIYGNIFVAEDEVSGHVTFLCNDTGRLREINSDVKYIYGATRRILRPLDIELEGDIQTEGSRVNFHFKVLNYIDAMTNYFSKKQGESE